MECIKTRYLEYGNEFTTENQFCLKLIFLTAIHLLIRGIYSEFRRSNDFYRLKEKSANYPSWSIKTRQLSTLYIFMIYII